MLMIGTISQAKVLCNVNSGDQKQDMVFDKMLITTDVSAPRYIIVKTGNTSAEEVQLTQFDTLEKWQAINGVTLISLSQQQNGGYGITASTVDVSKLSNMLPLDAVAIGPVADKQFLNLILAKQYLSIVCFQQ